MPGGLNSVLLTTTPLNVPGKNPHTPLLQSDRKPVQTGLSKSRYVLAQVTGR